jgi:hypothetical protein
MPGVDRRSFSERLDGPPGAGLGTGRQIVA